MANVVIKLNPAELRTLLAGPDGPVVADLHRRANRVLNRARQLVPVDQGTLKASLHVQPLTVNGMPAMRIGSSLHYARYVHDGTGIYVGRGRIYPRTARFLRWPAKNQSGQGRRRYKGGSTQRYIYARSIKGMKGTPYLLNALDAAR